MRADAQDQLLSHLDRLPPGRAVVGTGNLQPDLLTERFETRFQSITPAAPSTGELRRCSGDTGRWTRRATQVPMFRTQALAVRIPDKETGSDGLPISTAVFSFPGHRARRSSQLVGKSVGSTCRGLP